MKFHEGLQMDNAQYWFSGIGHFQLSNADQDQMKELRDGLRVGQLLELPFELSYNWHHLCSLLSTIIPFKQLKLVKLHCLNFMGIAFVICVDTFWRTFCLFLVMRML
jgi:hypothetical protein